MTHSNSQFQGSPVTLSVMVSEAVYKAVVYIERIIRLHAK